MKYLGNLRVEATRENLRTISYFIQGIAQRLQLSEDTLFDIELAVEEAATNIIVHAYNGMPPGNIDLHADLIGHSLRITLTDWGKPLDPSKVKPFDITAPIETRIKGGMGLHFIHNLMDGVERHTGSKLGEPNTLTLVKTIEHVRGITRSRRWRETQELSALQTISEVMTSNIELDELLRIIINKLVDTIEAERGTLYLIDEERGELWSKILLEDEHILPEIRVKIGEGIAGNVAETGEVLNIRDAHAHPLFNPSFDAKTGYYTRNILAVPMRNPQQKIIGVVQLLNKIGGDFTPADARLLSAMAAQAAISIENARLYQAEIQQKILERDLQTATNIQQSFLPESVPQLDGWEIAAFWKPVAHVAGDFYDFYPLEDGRLALVIADVSGKGIPAALFMALCVTVLRFGMSLNLMPCDMIERANRLILKQQRSRMFATVFVAYADLHSGEITYVSAGHNPPILYRAATGECEIVKAAGVALGVFLGGKYEEKIVRVVPQDVLVLYTDGITEIIDQDEQEFGDDRLEDLIRQNAHLSAQEIASLILHTIHEFAGTANSFDDETLIVLKRN